MWRRSTGHDSQQPDALVHGIAWGQLTWHSTRPFGATRYWKLPALYDSGQPPVCGHGCTVELGHAVVFGHGTVVAMTVGSCCAASTAAMYSRIAAAAM